MSLQPENGLYDLVSAATASLQLVLVNPDLDEHAKTEEAAEVVAILTAHQLRSLCPEDLRKTMEMLRWHEVGRCAVETSILRGQDAALVEFNDLEEEQDSLFGDFCNLFQVIIFNDPLRTASRQQVRAFRYVLDGFLLPFAAGRMSLDSIMRAATEARIAVLGFTENDDDPDPDDGETIAA